MQPEMTMRDLFAAAALTGLLARRDCYDHEIAVLAWDMADAMLRCRAGGDCPGPDNAPIHDAAPAAKADLPDERPPNAVSANGGTPCAASRDGSGTGNTQKPVAWAVMDGHEFMEFCTDSEEAKCAAGFYGDYPIIPLYRKPRPTLTDAEREAIDEAAVWYEGVDDDERRRVVAATLRGLLERLGGSDAV